MDKENLNPAALASADAHGDDSANSVTVTPDGRSDISAATIARMMGVATSADMRLLGSKIDLLVGKMNLLVTKIDKVMTAVGQMPTGSDLERIDVQLGSLKTLIRDTFGGAEVSKEVEKPASRGFTRAEETEDN